MKAAGGWRLAGRLCLAMGFAFIYLPLVAAVAGSFNAGRMAGVWAGFSLRWYQAALHDEAMASALWTSLRVAAVSATMASLIGALAGLGLSRPRGLPARDLFSLAIFAPLVLPDVLLGLSLLLMFVAAGWPRGFWTVAATHATAAVAYVAVVVRARLASLDPALEEAAQDLGASPAGAFFSVAVPFAAPALVAGWLLAFTLSLDDLVLASFASGPGSTTLPMRLYGQVRLGVTPEVNAVSTLLMLAASLAAAAYAVSLRRRERETAEGPAWSIRGLV